MIFFNGERFIEEAVESVLAQTYSHWELLMVDDGSSDGSTAIAQRYAREFPDKVRYLQHDRHENRGMSASRNLGIRNARGEYLAFLDADDVWRPQKLEKQVSILETLPQAGIVYGPTQYWYSWGGNHGGTRDCLPELGVPPNTLVEPPKLISRFLRGEAHIPNICGFLVRRSVVERVGGSEESFRGMYEDQVFCFKVCLVTAAFVEAGSWDRYRQHPQSCCQVAINRGEFRPGKLHSTELDFLKWLNRYLIEQGVDDKAIWQSLRRVLRHYRYPFLYLLSNLPKGFVSYIEQIARRTLPLRVRNWLRAQTRLGWHRACLSREEPPGERKCGCG
ncbi:MAG: glycosyltransferase family 2 protein [Verrucomicrobiota bacterium]|nr:glycosyltransferase family 2 protein [Verrucomicrobiota bacterium]